jgi:predicted transcriptional regulator
MIFGKNRDKGIRLNELDPEVVSLDQVAVEDLLVHNEFSPEPSLAYLLSRMRHPRFPEPVGVFRSIEKLTYSDGVLDQIKTATERRGKGDLKKLYHDADIWEVKPDTATTQPETNGHGGQAGVSPNIGSENDEEYTGVLFHGERSSDPYAVQGSLLTDTLSQLKPRKPLTAPASISLAEAIQRLKDLNVGLLALVDDQGKLVGVFTEGDVFKKAACQVEDLTQAKVSDYMTANVTTLKSDATIAYALHLMSLHRFRHVLIVDEAGRPDGVLSFRAVVHYLKAQFVSPEG